MLKSKGGSSTEVEPCQPTHDGLTTYTETCPRGYTGTVTYTWNADSCQYNSTNTCVEESTKKTCYRWASWTVFETRNGKLISYGTKPTSGHPLTYQNEGGGTSYWDVNEWNANRPLNDGNGNDFRCSDGTWHIRYITRDNMLGTDVGCEVGKSYFVLDKNSFGTTSYLGSYTLKFGYQEVGYYCVKCGITDDEDDCIQPNQLKDMRWEELDAPGTQIDNL